MKFYRRAFLTFITFAALCLCLSVSPQAAWQQDAKGWYYTNAAGVKVINTWQKDSKGWCYLGADGYMVTNGWAKDSQGWCYLGADGYAVTNCWKQDSTGWIWLNSNGSMTKNAWIQDGGKWYFLDESGYMVANQWRKDSTGWCWLTASGAMATNAWVKDSQGWCYVGADGYCLTNCWKKDSVGWIWLNANGSMTKNSWIQDGGKWYFLDGDGYMVANQWRKDSSGWCWLTASGAMATNAWVKDSQGWCYVGADGYMLSDQWLKYNNQMYYLNSSGHMLTGWQTIDGYRYYFYSSGIMAKNTTIDDETIGSDGRVSSDVQKLKAGFCRIVCVPDDPTGVFIAGGDAAADPATAGLLDTLAVTCIALEEGDKIYLIYTCDVVDIDSSFDNGTEAAVSQATGVPVDRIILNATHTHSAPTLKHNLPGRDEYLEKFNSACSEAGQKAIEDLSPATLSYGSVMTENMVRVRHYLMNDGTTYGNGHGSTASGFKRHLYDADEECQVIRISRNAADKKDIIMFNLAAHATIVSGTHTSSLSADFPGYARAFIEEQADVHAAYFIAAGGDQVPSSRISGEVPNGKNAPAYGRQLGAYVLDCLEDMTFSESNDVVLYNETYTAKRMKEGTDPERLEQAREIVALRNQYGNYSNSAVQAKIREYGFASYYEASGIVTRASAPETGSFPLGTMLLGDIGIVFFPGEMFGSQGKLLKDNSPSSMTFVITNSEDDQGYFPNAIGCEEKFYEYQITKYARGTGEAVAQRYCDILLALKNGLTPEPLN